MWGCWLGLFLGVALAACPGVAYATPDDPPTGFVWEDLKEIHARVLRPEKWFFRRDVRPLGPVYHFAPQAFEGDEITKGLAFAVVTKVKDQTGKSADTYAAFALADFAAKKKVLKGWTSKGEPPGPYTTSALVYLSTENGESETYMVKIVCVANRETDTLYWFEFLGPRAGWKDVEQWGDTMFAHLRLDPKF